LRPRIEKPQEVDPLGRIPQSQEESERKTAYKLARGSAPDTLKLKHSGDLSP